MAAGAPVSRTPVSRPVPVFRNSRLSVLSDVPIRPPKQLQRECNANPHDNVSPAVTRIAGVQLPHRSRGRLASMTCPSWSCAPHSRSRHGSCCSCQGMVAGPHSTRRWEHDSRRRASVSWASTRRKYFWSAQTPDGTTRDIERVLRHYLQAWRKAEFILAGYSFGADVLPVIVNRLAPDLRARITGISLIALGRDATWEVHPLDWVPGLATAGRSTGTGSGQPAEGSAALPLWRRGRVPLPDPGTGKQRDRHGGKGTPLRRRLR